LIGYLLIFSYVWNQKLLAKIFDETMVLAIEHIAVKKIYRIKEKRKLIFLKQHKSV
jgi:hypothetical protein